MSYQLTKEIKKQIACCTKDLNAAVVALQEGLDIPTDNNEMLTGGSYNNLPVYSSQIEVDLTGTAPVNPSLLTFTDLLSADLVFVNAAGEQYHLGSPSAVLAALCDAYVYVTSAGVLTVDWSTTHAAGDLLKVFLKYTRV